LIKARLSQLGFNNLCLRRIEDRSLFCSVDAQPSGNSVPSLNSVLRRISSSQQKSTSFNIDFFFRGHARSERNAPSTLDAVKSGGDIGTQKLGEVSKVFPYVVEGQIVDVYPFYVEAYNPVIVVAHAAPAFVRILVDTF
jgi:hypothetical protein